MRNYLKRSIFTNFVSMVSNIFQIRIELSNSVIYIWKILLVDYILIIIYLIRSMAPIIIIISKILIKIISVNKYWIHYIWYCFLKMHDFVNTNMLDIQNTWSKMTLNFLSDKIRQHNLYYAENWLLTSVTSRYYFDIVFKTERSSFLRTKTQLSLTVPNIPNYNYLAKYWLKLCWISQNIFISLYLLSQIPDIQNT